MSVTLVVAAAAWLAVGQLETAPPKPATSTVASAIADLSANQYDVRQAAMEQLWAAGDAAIPALEQALQSRSAEVRSRAQFVLDNLRMGIALDTPKAILQEVQRFRSDSVDQRRRAIQQLEAAGRPRIILSLLKTEPVERLRSEWYRALERTVTRSIAAGELNDVMETLRRAADDDTWLRHYAAFAMQLAEADAELAKLSAAAAADADTFRRRAFLHRAKGDLSEACREAEQVSAEFAVPLFIEHRDWAAAGRMLAAQIDNGRNRASADAELLGLTLSCFRLAGNPGEFDRFMGMLKSRGDEISTQLRQLGPDQRQPRRELVAGRWFVAKAMLLNGRFQEASELVRDDQLSFVFELLCEQRRYREAFECVGVAYPNGFDAEWFRKVGGESADDAEVVEKNFAIAQTAIRHLYFLGSRDDARKFFAVLWGAVRNDRDTRRLRLLCGTAVKLSFRQQAWDVAALIVQKEDRPSVLSVLYPSRSGTATLWWEHFRAARAAEPLSATLAQIDDILQPARFQERGGNLDSLVAEVAARIPSLPSTKHVESWHELAETCLLHGRRELALSYYARAAETSAHDALKVGDLHAAEAKWDTAADWYQKAWQFDKDKPLPLYLHGRAVRESGREAEGKRLMQLASLMPMANEDLRHELAAGLKERGYRDESLEQFDLLLRTGESRSGRVVDSAKQIGNLVYVHDELRAADCWQTMLLCCLKPSWSFVETGGYVQIPFLVHKTRATGLLKAGQINTALQEMRSSETASPGNLELAEELVPLLDSKDQRRAADELFARSANRLREVLQGFPDCATLHNNLAWLCARCDRDLDDALAHAKRALEIEPDKPSFIDTLGEVYFRRGQLDEALACAERCLTAEPRNAHFIAQLDRFRKAQPLPP